MLIRVSILALFTILAVVHIQNGSSPTPAASVARECDDTYDNDQRKF